MPANNFSRAWPAPTKSKIVIALYAKLSNLLLPEFQISESAGKADGSIRNFHYQQLIHSTRQAQDHGVVLACLE